MPTPPRIPKETQELLDDIERVLDPNIEEPSDSYPRSDTFRERLYEDAEEKIALAKIYTKVVASGSSEVRVYEVDPVTGKRQEDQPPLMTWWNRRKEEDPASIFFESGSTLLYASHALRSRLAKPNFQVFTNNNLLGILYLSNREDLSRPYLFPGFLERKYEGTFPFRPTLAENVNEKGRQIEMEQGGYVQCRSLLASCDLLILATSRLSLTYGPMVGSRENALFKNATYNALVRSLILQPGATDRQDIHLLISYQKLVSESGDLKYTLDHEIKQLTDRKCYPVFDILLDDVGDYTWSPLAQLAVDRDPLEDGTDAVHFGAMAFRMCTSWRQLFRRARINVKVFVAFPADERRYIDVLRREVQLAKYRSAGHIDYRWYEYDHIAHVDGKAYQLGCIVLEPPPQTPPQKPLENR